MMRQVSNIVDSLNSDETKKDLDRVRAVDPVTALKISIYEFYKQRMRIILEEDEIKKEAEKELLRRIRLSGEDGGLSTSQLISLVSSSKTSASIATDSILSPLKPVPNSTNNLLTVNEEQKDNEIMQAFNDLQPDQAEQVAQFIRLMNVAVNLNQGPEQKKGD